MTKYESSGNHTWPKVDSKATATAMAEVGVYKGGSAWFIAKVADERGVDLHLFDTFTGIPFHDPKDSNRIFVAVVGKLYSDGGEPGVYRSIDGGKTWSRVLKGDRPHSGAIAAP